MHVVAICNWKDESAGLVQALANALGITLYEARQRMTGNGPAVAASYADPQAATELAVKLDQSGFTTRIFDAAALRDSAGYFLVHRFELKKWSITIESSAGQLAEIPWDEVELLLPCTSIVGVSGQKTVIERKLSIGKTILSGGLPMTTKVERQEAVTSEVRSKVLYLYAGKRLPVIFSQAGMTFEGLGDAMKLSQAMNFAYLASELRRLCREAVYNDLLLNQLGLVRVLGPGLNSETNLNLAVEVLVWSLRQRGA